MESLRFISAKEKKKILGVARTDPFFFHKLSPKMAIFRRFGKIFSELATELQLKLLILIESPNIFHWKLPKKKKKKMGVVLG